MDEKPHWDVWEFDMEISCKEVAYNCMWITPYIQYYIQHRVSSAIVAITITH
jgi:hypothetical protein